MTRTFIVTAQVVVTTENEFYTDEDAYGAAIFFEGLTLPIVMDRGIETSITINVLDETYQEDADVSDDAPTGQQPF